MVIVKLSCAKFPTPTSVDLHEEATSNNRRRNNLFNHACETSRLLKEFRDDPICFCEFNNEDFDDIVSNCNEMGNFMHKNCTKKQNKSKQLLIYNEEGCIKGIEVNKRNSEILSNLTGFDSSNRTQVQDPVIIEDDFHSDTCSDSVSSPVEREGSFVYKPSNCQKFDPSKSTSHPLMPQLNPCVALERLETKKKKRKRSKKRLYFTSRKSKGNSATKPKIKRERKHSVPCSVTFKQSHTQVSVEEVHVAQSKRSVGRPRRSTNPKSASEMLMLKRKIVQSTIEYQSNKFPNQQFHSNLAGSVSFNSHFKSKNNGTVAKQNQERRLVRCTRGAKFSRELEKYGPNVVPPGWDTQVVTRKSGKSAGQIDVYFITPDGKRLRSRTELALYIEKNDLPFMVEEFIFRKTAYM